MKKAKPLNISSLIAFSSHNVYNNTINNTL